MRNEVRVETNGSTRELYNVPSEPADGGLFTQSTRGRGRASAGGSASP
jgi:hypothetical protein